MRRNINRIALPVLGLIFCLFLFASAVFAATDSSRSFDFEFTVNGGTAATVSVGEELSFQVELKRTDGGRSGEYTMYSMQDEIIFDSSYFSLVESSMEIAASYDFNVRTLEDGVRKRIIISRVVVSPAGASTPDNLIVATFKLAALAPIQGETITSRNYRVNARTGETYITTGNDVTVTVKGPGPAHHAVVFDGGEGAVGTPPSVGGQAEGDRFTLPDNTFRKEGYIFTGWNDGAKTYAAGDNYVMPGHAVTFTARWQEDTGSDKPPGGDVVPPEGSPDFEVIIDPDEMDDKNITLDETDEGILLIGDDLSALSLQISKSDQSRRMDIQTDENEVLLKETNDGNVEAFIDPDGDGIFDTPIARVDFGKGKKNALLYVLIVIGIVALAAALGLLIIRRKKW